MYDPLEEENNNHLNRNHPSVSDCWVESMKYFFDTEFIEDGKTIDLVSIGIVSEDGREFYAESWAIPWNKASGWVLDNVKPHLTGKNVLDRVEMRNAVLDFIGEDKPEFWAYYADYDWVVLCQLFGRMIDLPKGWPMYCRDIKQLCDSLGNPELPQEGKGEHHALADARWNMSAYNFLKTKE